MALKLLHSVRSWENNKEIYLPKMLSWKFRKIVSPVWIAHIFHIPQDILRHCTVKYMVHTRLNDIVPEYPTKSGVAVSIDARRSPPGRLAAYLQLE